MLAGEPQAVPADEAFRTTQVEPIERAHAVSETAEIGEDAEQAIENLAVEQTPEEPVLTDRWQLTGVVHAGDESVIILADRNEERSFSLAVGSMLDGWVVKDSGPDFAVLEQDGEELRLSLNDNKF